MSTSWVAMLAGQEGREALVLATAQADPGSLSAAQALRDRFSPDLAAAALSQAELRRRAAVKFGAAAGSLLYTRNGLEQATRPEVAAHHAQRFLAAGATRVVDLGCGIGSDALAFADAGLEVVAVELDPDTADVARTNLGDRGQVVQGDAELLADRLLRPGDAVFCDPARRTAAGRVWRVEDFTPSWSFVSGLLSGDRPAGVKLGPALPHSLVPETAEAEWVSHRGDTLEVGLWSGAAGQAGARVALLLDGRREPGQSSPAARLVVPGDVPQLDTAAPGAYVYEPDGAVIRAGGVSTVGQLVQGHLLDPQIAYLTSDVLVETPYAVPFEVLEVLPYKEKAIRRWIAEHGIGTVEIKKRGVDVDPAQLRKKLGLAGSGSCTIILSRTPRGALALMVRRLAG